jgi:hypothetical protein
VLDAAPRARIDSATHRTLRRPGSTTVIAEEIKMIAPWKLFVAVLCLLAMLAILVAFVVIPDNTHVYYWD